MTPEQFSAILGELRLLREAVERRPAPAPDAAALVQAVYEHVGDRVFSARELVEHSKLSEAAALRAALGGLSPRRLGRALRRIEGQEFDGVAIESCGADRGGMIWRASYREKLTRDDSALAKRARVTPVPR